MENEEWYTVEFVALAYVKQTVTIKAESLEDAKQKASNSTKCRSWHCEEIIPDSKTIVTKQTSWEDVKEYVGDNRTSQG